MIRANRETIGITWIDNMLTILHKITTLYMYILVIRNIAFTSF